MAIKNYVYSDYDQDLDRQNDGDIEQQIDVQAIRNSLLNIIKTRPGTRRMLPTFATNLFNILFEPMDEQTARLLAEAVLEGIEIWEDRIDVQGFDIEPIYDKNFYRCRLQFNIVGSDKIEEINFVLSR
jgi:phage baseplate assembly protein W